MSVSVGQRRSRSSQQDRTLLWSAQASTFVVLICQIFVPIFLALTRALTDTGSSFWTEFPPAPVTRFSPYFKTLVVFLFSSLKLPRPLHGGMTWISAANSKSFPCYSVISGIYCVSWVIQQPADFLQSTHTGSVSRVPGGNCSSPPAASPHMYSQVWLKCVWFWKYENEELCYLLSSEEEVTSAVEMHHKPHIIHFTWVHSSWFTVWCEFDHTDLRRGLWWRGMDNSVLIYNKYCECLLHAIWCLWWLELNHNLSCILLI